MEHGLSAKDIAKRIYKADGKETFGETAIQNCMNKLKEQPRWKGERAGGSGRPRKTTSEQDEAMVDWLLEHRGEEKVGVLLF